MRLNFIHQIEAKIETLEEADLHRPRVFECELLVIESVEDNRILLNGKFNVEFTPSPDRPETGQAQAEGTSFSLEVHSESTCEPFHTSAAGAHSPGPIRGGITLHGNSPDGQRQRWYINGCADERLYKILEEKRIGPPEI